MSQKSINILVSYSFSLTEPVSEANLIRIRAVSPRIKLTDITSLVYAEKQGDKNARECLNTLLIEAEIYCGFPVMDDMLQRAPNIKWIQSAIAGTDRYMSQELIASPVILTKASIHDQQISEMVFNLMLMLARRSLEYLRAQEQKQRVRLQPMVLHSKTVGILGLGNIGRAVARRAKAFGMKVVATKAHPQQYRYVDVILPPSRTHELLSISDFVVILLPITKETTKLIGEAELRMMRPTAYLINVARGGIVDQEPLIRALRENWIAGAALDVLASDPNPPPDEIWELKNVILTPHIAGQRVDYSEMLTKFFCQNLRRYITGKKLHGVVDKTAGY